ncbi:MAG: hypothetical protein AB7U20_09845 [Planctomycetaceae bacterium]
MLAETPRLPLLLAEGGSNAALATFLIYMVGVFGLAWAANRLLREKEFLSEYFLGSRGLGMWAFALTFAATSASGGTFTGFPALIYTHGWILALWIASYMVVPICGMGLFGKRINQVARKAGAITVPDIFRERYDSRMFGLLTTALIVFFMAFNLVAQFKAGSLILQTLIADVEVYNAAKGWLAGHLPDSGWLQTAAGTPVDSGYLLCLLIFGLTVVVYTTYGGFHAVVWTDVMQGVVMLLGVLIMLPLALSQVGGLERGTRELAKLEAPQVSQLTVVPSDESREAGEIPAGRHLVWTDAISFQRRAFRTSHPTPVPQNAEKVRVYAFVIPVDEVNVLNWRPSDGTDPLDDEIIGLGPRDRHTLVTGPAYDPKNTSGFLPFGVAISFFFMWAISGAGQPQYMVRLMAFKNTQTLRRAIITVTIYYSLIYFPLVIIFCCARVLMPTLDGQADTIMPKMAVFLTENAGVAWLAGLLVAAPFAAVMSTVDSFLLVVSSALVRDIYQQNINPNASEKTMKWLSYFATLAVGLVALAGAINPPTFLQDIIVYVGSGLAACFLFPVAAMLYWPRSNKWGCLAGMLGGFAAHLSMHLIGWYIDGQFVTPYLFLGFSPILVGLAASLICTLAITLITPPPPEHLVRKYFYCAASQSRARQ